MRWLSTLCDSLYRLVSSSRALLCFPYCYAASALVCPFLHIIVTGITGSWVLYQPSRQGLDLSLQQYTRCISCPFAIFGISSISFLCCNWKMRPPPRVQVDFEFSLLLLLAGDFSLNPGPGVRGLRLGTVNGHSMRDKAPALSDLAASKRIDLLGITETWLTTKETSADLADVSLEGFSFFHQSRTRLLGSFGSWQCSHLFWIVSSPWCSQFGCVSFRLGCARWFFWMFCGGQMCLPPPGHACAD